MDFNKDKLQAMKRTELQKLCKTFGIKANMKTSKLIEALIQHGCAKENMVVNHDDKCSENNTLSEAKEMESNNKHDPESKNNEKRKAEENPKEERQCQSQIPCFKQTSIKKVENAKTKTTTKNKTSNTKNSKIPHLSRTSKKKVESVTLETTTKSKTPSQSKIPQQNQTLTKKAVAETATPKTTTKNKTPKPMDFAKIHKRQFDKMESLPDYLEKKRKRAAELTNSAKRMKVLTDQKDETHQDAVGTPQPQQQKSVNKKRLTFASFSMATKENAVPPTPETAKRRATFGANRRNDGTIKPPASFRFSTTPNPFSSPTPKKTFDLKASLAKPLPYKPHKGKLPTLLYLKEKEKPTSSLSRARNYKAPKVTTREGRRKQQTKNRAKKRECQVTKRRGDMDV